MTATSEAEREEAHVPGAYESIDPKAKRVETFKLSGDGHMTKSGQSLVLETKVDYLEGNNVKASGTVKNSYNRVTRELVMKEHFLDKIPSDKRWIEKPEFPIVPNRGTRLITYVNLRQIKIFEQQAGDAAIQAVKEELRRQGMSTKLDPAQESKLREENALYAALKHVTLDNVMNVKALLQLHQLIGNGEGADLNQLIMKTSSIPYVRTILLQAGGRLKSAEVVGPRKVPIGDVMAVFEGNANVKRRPQLRAEHDELLTTYGATRATEVLAHFDVKLMIEPFPKT